MLETAARRGLRLDPLKLQKLLYYAHGWHLALTGRPLLDRTVEAWQYGPVLPDVYRAFRSYGAQPITAPARDLVRSGTKLLIAPYELPPEDAAVTYADRIIERVVEQYGNYSGVQLSAMTHGSATPWARAWQQHAGKRFVPIPDADITAYFREILKPVAA